MGLTALLGVAFHTFDYKQGLDAVFFWTCLQLASQTPFTTCEVPGSFHAFVVTLGTLGLFYLGYLHLDARGDAKGEPVAEEDEPQAVAQQDAVADPEKAKGTESGEALVEEGKPAADGEGSEGTKADEAAP